MLPPLARPTELHSPRTPSVDTPSNLPVIRHSPISRKLTKTSFRGPADVEFDPSNPDIKARFREFATDGAISANELKRGLSLTYQTRIADQLTAYLKKNYFDDFVMAAKLADYCQKL